MKEPAMQGNPEQEKKLSRVMARAWRDDDFKKRLLADPAAVLNENGIEIPEGVTVKIREWEENEICLILPSKPRDLVGSVEEVAKNADRSSGCWACTPQAKSCGVGS
jgi:hypothetical protein